MRTLYTIALRLALPLILLRLWWRSRREPGYLEGIEERFGFYSGSRPEKAVWVHAVSVGEARAAAPLVRALKEALPDHAVVMTGTTAAGVMRCLYGLNISAFMRLTARETPRRISSSGLPTKKRPSEV